MSPGVTGATRGSSGLGAGLVELPPVPFRDPLSALLRDSAVLGDPALAPGSQPKLPPGELVADQYEVEGCVARGGMGWIYLARDHHVSDRWVVLKGVLDAEDVHAIAAALAERRFLAEVEHPNIVRIFNFVQHERSGYIVMEYVGGKSLRQLLLDRREANNGVFDPLPPAQAVAYVLEILPAIGHLHELGLLFCDFKLDNVMQTRRSLKLIDLGGVRRVGDPAAGVFGTTGYQAPEVEDAGPSIASDLYTIGRALAVMCADFRGGFTGAYTHTLPPRASVPAFVRHDSLFRLVRRATAEDPEDRFRSVAELSEQLYGVLREIVAADGGRRVSEPSSVFTAPLPLVHYSPDWRALPRPHIRPPELELWQVAAMIDAGDWEGAERLIAAVAVGDRYDWRTAWYRGLAALARGRPAEARAGFQIVYGELPGEPAPKLAIALAYECEGEPAQAAEWYEVVSRTDPEIVAATFGLARCLLASGDRAGAVAAYSRVGPASSAFLDAQTAQIRCLAAAGGSRQPTADELLAGAARLEAMPVEGEQRLRLTAELLEPALALAAAGRAPAGSAILLGRRFAEHDLRVGLERCYRALAARAEDRSERIRLVDRANRVRPRTWT
jgi:serine/threonine-protein kinase PknG